MSNNKKYYWLKLKDDFFRTREIKKLRKIAGGDTYTIIYLKMQLLSIKKEGLILYEGTEESLVEQLSLELDEDEDNVKMTLAFLQTNKLIEQLSGDEYLLNRVPESIGSESQAAERMRRMREKRNNVTKELQPVTNSYTEIEKEIEKDIEIEKERDKEEKPTPSIKYDEIKQLFNDKCISLPQIAKMTDKRKQLIKARIREHGLESIYKVIDNTSNSKFMAGDNNRNWIATFDWIIRPNNYIKVLEGNYNDKGGKDEPDNGGDQYDLEKHGIGISL